MFVAAVRFNSSASEQPQAWFEAFLFAQVPTWSEKTDALFWRGAATSTYRTQAFLLSKSRYSERSRKQVVPLLASLELANVSMMEWVIGPEGQRQVGVKKCFALWAR